ncbi:hypothetical protein [Deinococcus sp.]|uniref:hypothetical protein n=1 Tax=Deinococcus sp. TaxID=47478 RepID=UPI003C7A90DB
MTTITEQRPNDLLTVAQMYTETGLGRSLARQLCKKLPAIICGRRGTGHQIRVYRSDVQTLLRLAADEQLDLWILVRAYTATDIQAWLRCHRQAQTGSS